MFDPYRKWLGLPSDQRPPTHYQLLGLAAGESDAEIIEEAAIRQSTHVRAYQMGPHAQECTKLLNEIALARSTLMDPVKRKKYDQTIAPKETAIASAPVESRRSEFIVDDETPVVRSATKAGKPKRKAKASTSPPVWIYAAIGGGVFAVLAIVVVVVLLSRPGPEIKQTNNVDKLKEKTPPKRIVEKPPEKTVEKVVDKEPVVKLPKEEDKKPVFVPEINRPPLDLGPAAPSPLDRLDPAKIEAVDRPPGMPELVAVAKGAAGEVFGVSISPDSKWLGAADNRGQITVWDISGDEPGPAVVLATRNRPTNSVAFSPDSKFAAYPTGTKVRIYDLATGAMKDEIDVESPQYAVIAYSPDGKTIAVGTAGGVEFVDLASRTKKLLPIPGGAYKVRYNTEGTRLLTSAAGRPVRVFDMTGDRPMQTHQISPANRCFDCDFSPDAKSIVVGEDSGLVSLWDISGPDAVERWAKKDHIQWANSVSFAPDGKTLISTEGGTQPRGPLYVNWRRADTGDLIKQIPLPERSSSGAFGPSGLYAAISNHNRKVYVVRLNTK